MFKNSKRHSITKRWLLNSLGIVIAVLAAVEIFILGFTANYYHSTVKTNLSTEAEYVTSALSKHETKQTYASELQSIVEKYDKKQVYELMVLNSKGEVVVTSSGFTPSELLGVADLELAKNSESGSVFYETILYHREKVQMYTALLPNGTNDYYALRIMTSLNGVNNQITNLAMFVTVIVISIIFLVVSSGMYFVKSIVIPVREFRDVAGHYAKGDFGMRIEKRRDDELGELADAINYMAQELDHSDRMQNEFISSVSHELRTPLTAIKGWSETALQMPDDPETVQKAMRVITGETQRLSEMVEELLDFSRIQDGRFVLQKQNCDLLAELEEAVLIYGERSKQLGIEIDYNEPQMLPVVHGDPARLRQVFINIIDNAVKYSNEGGKITVKAFKEGTEIAVTVADNGVGISQEDLPKIKTKFYKANQTRRGSGIGLAVANEIVEMHGGSLTIKSEQGRGTTVKICLPYTKI